MDLVKTGHKNTLETSQTPFLFIKKSKIKFKKPQNDKKKGDNYSIHRMFTYTSFLTPIIAKQVSVNHTWKNIIG